MKIILRSSLVLAAAWLAAPDALSQVPAAPPPAVPGTGAAGARGGGGGRGGAGFGPRFPVKPRVIASTDGEIDDRCSMIRFLLYANEFDVEGIIYSSSRFHWLGHTWSGVEWINAQLDQYARIYGRLRENADGYPTPEELKRVVYVGNISNVGEMDKDSPGSDRIVQVLLDDDPGPVYLQAWGGTNTIARALKKIQEQYPSQIEKVNQKAVIYIILDQDNTYRNYIQPNWPKIQVLGSFQQYNALAYGWANQMPPSVRQYFERPWMEANITVDRGPLAGAYEPSNGAFRSEGDSPSYMFNIDVGLRSMENPSYGGWGGRFAAPAGADNLWSNVGDDGNMGKAIWRWGAAFQNDFAARAAWSVKPYREANHAPVVFLETPKDVEAAPGARVKLSVRGSSDPDGDRLDFNWWQYADPGTYKGDAVIRDADKSVAWLDVPPDAKPGETLHMIAEVTDNGKPALTRYARVVVKVK